MLEIYKKVVFENYANFKGRARRKEYWLYTLLSTIISIVLNIVDSVSGLTIGTGKTGILGLIYGLAVFLPGLAISVRRFHDIGKSGWEFFISQILLICAFIGLIVVLFQGDRSVMLFFLLLILLAGLVWVLVLFCKEGDKGSNKYGADPKNLFEELDEIGKE